MLSVNARQFASAALYHARRRRLLRPAWWALLAVALVALAAGVVTWRAQSRESAALQAELIEATAQAAATVAAAKPAPAAQHADFTAVLPQTAPMDNLLRDTFRTAASVGVTVVSAEPQEAAMPVTNVLPHATLALRLAGPYEGIKTVLGELLARYPGLTVQQLRIQRTSGGAQEATLMLQQWLRPWAVPQPSAGVGG